MKRAWLLACAILAWSLAGQAASAPEAAATVERRLDNGMKVVVKPDRRAPVVVSQVWYRAGSMDESYGGTGVAHVLEHMMFKGTRDVPAGEFSKRIAGVGGRENAFTSRDHTAYFQTLGRDNLELAIRLEADRMANLVLAPEEFAKEINVVMEERRLRTEDNPSALLHEKLLAAAYTSHPYRHPVIGWMDDLKQMTVDDARRWYEAWYAPNNATLVVVGDVDPEQVFDLARKYFGALPARPLPARKNLGEVPPSGMQSLVLKAPAKLPEVSMVWAAPRLADPAKDWEAYALEMLAGVLDGHGSARLPKSLVKDARLADEVGAGYDPVARGPALFMIAATPAEGVSVDSVVSGIKAQLERLKSDGVAEDELRRVKAQVLSAQVYQQDSLFYQGMLIGEWETAGLDYRARGQRLEGLRKVTPEQVREVARKYLVDDRLTLARLDPLPVEPGKAPAKPMGGGHVH
jgi:zinc protease